jgi:hypothetical protein
MRFQASHSISACPLDFPGLAVAGAITFPANASPIPSASRLSGIFSLKMIALQISTSNPHAMSATAKLSNRRARGPDFFVCN